MIRYFHYSAWGFIFALVLLFLGSSCIHQANTDEKNKITINTLVIPSRNHTRMQPEIYYALMSSGKHVEPIVEFEFELILQYMDRHPGSHLAQVSQKIDRILDRYQFLIIESSDTYGIHPIYYLPGITTIETPEGANTKDMNEALYSLLFLEAGFQQDKLIWGSCHGAQIGYIYAGGMLGRLFDYKEGGYEDISFRKSAPKYIDEEVWHIDNMLYTQEPGTHYQKSAITVYKVPDLFKPEGKKQEMLYLNKDFQHSLAMIPPIPKAIEVISYHPMSEYQSKDQDSNYCEINVPFIEVLNNQVIVDAYLYKTMLGVQYHPQYTYDDMETALVFDYLVKQIMD